PHIGVYGAKEVESHAQTAPAGSAMLMIAASANRDPDRWDDPDRFDIHRNTAGHITFGYGAHFCLGAALARLEGRVVLDEMLKRWPEWEVDLDGAHLAPTSTVRGYETLPIRVA
ncbi:MAG TPA: cytochrome P450, partial [Acidimicrobiales bacterium]|nr:cytochrome P450 [Acidimicrobiales bacterium]